jgi:hypothetical protein
VPANSTHLAPPQPSKAELERAEAQTTSDIKWTFAGAVVLYLCTWDRDGCVLGLDATEG